MIALSFEGGEVSPLDLSVRSPASVIAEVNFPFANDSNLHMRFIELNQTSGENTYQKSDCAILVGNSALLSLIPVLPEQIMLTDYSPAHLRWMNVLVEQVKETPKLSRFLGWVHPLLLDEIDEPRQEAMFWEASSMDRFHHTSSQIRYANSRAKLLDSDIGFVEIDYRDQPAVEAFGDFLRTSGYNIRVANFTNIMRHIFTGMLPDALELPEEFTSFYRGLKSLPLASHAQIFGSGFMQHPMPAGATMEQYLQTATAELKSELFRMLAKELS